MIKVSGKHKSIPKEIKVSLKKILDSKTKIVMQDICSCRHRYSVGAIKITKENQTSIKLRGYYGSGIVNLFIKFESENSRNIATKKIKEIF